MKRNKGITMVALILTIVILLILAGISINTGSKVIKQTQLENIKTNMLLIKVKAKEIAENASSSLGLSFDTITDENERNARLQQMNSQLKGEKIDNINELNIGVQKQEDVLEVFCKLSTSDLEDMGLTNVESNGLYIIKYDIRNIEVEVYYTKGVQVENQIYYSLTEIQDLDI